MFNNWTIVQVQLTGILHRLCFSKTGARLFFLPLVWPSFLSFRSDVRVLQLSTNILARTPTYLRETRSIAQRREPGVLPRTRLLRFDPSLLKEKTKNANTNQSSQLSTNILARIHLTQHQHPREPPRTATPRPSPTASLGC